MARLALEIAYPNVQFRPRTRNWWARLSGHPPECVHLETEHSWMATLVPDQLYLRGKGRAVRDPVRPDVSVCSGCLLGVAKPELEKYTGRVVAFAPDPQAFSQYFFLGERDFELAGLVPEVAAAIQSRLKALEGSCEKCAARATWLWFSREEVPSLDDVSRIASERGQRLCPGHAAAKFCLAMGAIEEANLFYVNLPYAEAGAYVWI